MTDTLSARLRSGDFYIEDVTDAADEIDRLTATVKEYHREKQLVLDAAKGMDDFRAKADALDEVRQEGFQAGLKRAAEITEFLSDTLVDGLEDTASQSERDYAERKAVEIQQAILKEIIP